LLWNTLPEEFEGIKSTRPFTKKLKECVQGSLTLKYLCCWAVMCWCCCWCI